MMTGHGVDLLRVRHDHAVLAQEARPARRLEQLEGDDEIGLALVDDRGIDLLAERT